MSAIKPIRTEACEVRRHPIPEPTEHHAAHPNANSIIRCLALPALAFYIFGLASCHVSRTVRVTGYAQGRQLAAEYARHYNPRQKPDYWRGPPAFCTYLRRTNTAREPIILGRVEELLENGALIPAPTAIITIDQHPTFANETGDYACPLRPGQHSARAGWPGLLWSEVPPFRVAQGDSIRVNFRLLPDFRPLIN